MCRRACLVASCDARHESRRVAFCSEPRHCKNARPERGVDPCQSARMHQDLVLHRGSLSADGWQGASVRYSTHHADYRPPQPSCRLNFIARQNQPVAGAGLVDLCTRRGARLAVALCAGAARCDRTRRAAARRPTAICARGFLVQPREVGRIVRPFRSESADCATPVEVLADAPTGHGGTKEKKQKARTDAVRDGPGSGFRLKDGWQSRS